MLQTLKELSVRQALKSQHRDRLVTVKMDLTDEASAEKKKNMRAKVQKQDSAVWMAGPVGQLNGQVYQVWSRAELAGNMQVSPK